MYTQPLRARVWKLLAYSRCARAEAEPAAQAAIRAAGVPERTGARAPAAAAPGTGRLLILVFPVSFDQFMIDL